MVLGWIVGNKQHFLKLLVVLNMVHLKKAILARAFRGELGTNDPAEESAEELLKKNLNG